MRIRPSTVLAGLILGASILVTTPSSASAQGRGKGDATKGDATTASVSVTLLLPSVRDRILEFYSARAAIGAQALPPGIRRRLARGKPLPPGIAMKVVPAKLGSSVKLPAGFEIVEVGTDVLLIEAATHIIHDILKDVVR